MLAFRVAALAVCGLSIGISTLHAETVEEFYRKNTITLSIGLEEGGGYDLMGRLIGGAQQLAVREAPDARPAPGVSPGGSELRRVVAHSTLPDERSLSCAIVAAV